MPFLGPLYGREPWKQEIYPDYFAPIVRAAGDGVEAVLVNVGMIPKAHRLLSKRYMTVNARSETLGEKPAFRTAWQAGQHCACREQHELLHGEYLRECRLTYFQQEFDEDVDYHPCAQSISA
ncbi:SOS response-associated peptidase [Burkholderia glumae]|uniref:SOS response-associated peptidase n=1 Tax=Burkholderia glumae TaxID=337 RepID=UPI002036AA3D|nr:SOS response-associated peptidase [Burkholderia glumae]MCM2547643.1 SOS response-associated peptidase [Burkholderia glumae]